MSMLVNRPLDGDERLPLYQRLADAIKHDITSGAHRPGDRLPSENIFADDFGLAAGTVRQALARLVDEGYLERIHGKGTFVRKPSFDQSLFRFFRIRDEAGERVLPEGQILQRKIAMMPEAVASALKVATDEPGIYMQRLRKVNGETVMTEEIWLPLAPFQKFMDTPLDEIGDLLYPVYDSLCGHTVIKVDEYLTVGVADDEIANSLGMKTGEPVVEINRLAFGYEGNPLEWRSSRGRASQFQYHVEIR